MFRHLASEIEMLVFKNTTNAKQTTDACHLAIDAFVVIAERTNERSLFANERIEH